MKPIPKSFDIVLNNGDILNVKVHDYLWRDPYAGILNSGYVCGSDGEIWIEDDGCAYGNSGSNGYIGVVVELAREYEKPMEADFKSNPEEFEPEEYTDSFEFPNY